MKKDKIEEFSTCIRGLIDALGYKPDVRKSVVELINELVAKNKSDSEVLKLREEECTKLRDKVNGMYRKSVLSTVYGVPMGDKSYVNFDTPDGDLPIMIDTDIREDLDYIHTIYNELRDYLKDALKEIDSLNEELDEECQARKDFENERDTNDAIISAIYAHYSANEYMDYQDFLNIIEFCREWI